MKKNIKKQNEKIKLQYFAFYDDIKDHTKGFKEDW